MQVGLVQLDSVWEQRETNHAKVDQLLRDSPPKEGSLLLLPEMFASGFSMNVDAITDDRDRATQDFLRQNIAARWGVSVLAGIVQRDSTLLGRNSAVAFDGHGESLAEYCKLHPFSLSDEHKHYTPGKEIVTFAWGEFIVAPFICYDLRFPEIFRIAAGRGANLFCVIANWPEPRIGHWITLLQARAIENQAYVAGVNRVGTDPTLRYPGRSMVIDPMGNIVVDSGDREGITYADLRPELVQETRAKFPFLKDMRSVFGRDYFPNKNSST
ncbi:carbon-nitrogen family hydrolase [soil metagenome]